MSLVHIECLQERLVPGQSCRANHHLSLNHHIQSSVFQGASPSGILSLVSKILPELLIAHPDPCLALHGHPLRLAESVFAGVRNPQTRPGGKGEVVWSRVLFYHLKRTHTHNGLLVMTTQKKQDSHFSESKKMKIVALCSISETQVYHLFFWFLDS